MKSLRPVCAALPRCRVRLDPGCVDIPRGRPRIDHHQVLRAHQRHQALVGCTTQFDESIKNCISLHHIPVFVMCKMGRPSVPRADIAPAKVVGATMQQLRACSRTPKSIELLSSEPKTFSTTSARANTKHRIDFRERPISAGI